MAGRPHFAGRVVTLFVVCLVFAGCSGQAPTAPEPMGAAANIGQADALVSPLAKTSPSPPVHAKTRTSRSYDLLEGAFTMTLADGSEIWGTYHGAATVPSSGQSRATLEGVVTGGTGLFAGTTGDLTGTGTGGFVDDGEFSVALRAAVVRGNGTSVDVRAALKGISTSTCTTTAPPRLALAGTGSARGMDSASAHLEHNLGAQICAIVVE